MPSTGDLRERLIRMRDQLQDEADRDTLEEAVNVLVAYDLEARDDLKPFPVWHRKEGTRTTAYISDEPRGSAARVEGLLRDQAEALREELENREALLRGYMDEVTYNREHAEALREALWKEVKWLRGQAENSRERTADKDASEWLRTNELGRAGAFDEAADRLSAPALSASEGHGLSEKPRVCALDPCHYPDCRCESERDLYHSKGSG